MKLAVDEEELALCVSCGLCLPHCPTYRVTGEESASPRGRIAAMRLVQGGEEAGEDFARFMDLCVQCRGCEAACPSSVPFGRLMEGARHSLAEGRRGRWWERVGFALLGHRRLLRAASLGAAAGGVVGRRLVPGWPRVAWRRGRLPASGRDAVLFTGCVMDAWSRPVHAAALRVMQATGAGVTPSPARAGCCGALAAHAGLTDLATRQAGAVLSALSSPKLAAVPVVVDSAGCGAWMKDYGRVLGPAGEDLAARVRDIHEWLAGRSLPVPAAPLPVRVAVQDPCHLRHVQRSHLAVREVLAPFVAELVEIADDGLCCGAGGSYALRHPDLAGRIRDRKLAALAVTGADVVASANPGCVMHLAAAAPVPVRHPVELIDEALGG